MFECVGLMMVGDSMSEEIDANYSGEFFPTLHEFFVDSLFPEVTFSIFCVIWQWPPF